MDGRKIFGSTSSKSIMLSKLLVFFTETYFELLSAGSLHTPQSLMSRPRSWQSNGHSVSGRNKIVDWAPPNILIVNCRSLRSIHKWPGSDRQDGDDLFIRSADARQTSSLLLTPNIQPKLYDVHTQSPANSWSLPLPSPVSWRVLDFMGLKRIILAKYSSP